MSRFLLWTSLFLGALVIAIGVAVQTDWLRDRVLTEVLDAASESWSVERIDGRLLTDLTIEGLELEVADVTIRIGRLNVRPALERILFGQVGLRTLLVEDLDVRLPAEMPEGDPDAEAAEIRLPLSIALDSVVLRRFRLIQEDNVLVENLGLSLRLRGLGQNLDLDRIRLQWPDQGLMIVGDARVSLAGHNAFTALLDITREDPDDALPKVESRVLLAGDRQQVRGQARLAGRIAGNVVMEWNLNTEQGLVRADIRRLEWDALPPEWALYRLDLEASGGPSDLEWRLALDAGWEDLRPRLRADGHLREDRVELRQAHLALKDNELTLSGTMDLAEPFAFAAELEGQDLDLSPWLPEFPTRLDVATAVDGLIGATASERRIEVRRLAVDGTWGDAPARVRSVASVSWPDEVLNVGLEHLELEVGDNRIDGHGQVREIIDIDLTAALQDIGQLWPGLSGAVRGTVRARGTPEVPDLELNLAASGVSQGDIAASEITVAGRLSLDPDQRTALSLRAREIRSGDQMAHVTADVSGIWPALESAITLDVPSAQLIADLVVKGNVIDLDPLRLTALNIQQPQAGTWQLESPLELSRGVEGEALLTWSATCLTGPRSVADLPSRLCLAAGRMLDTGPILDATLSDVDLAQFAQFLPEWVEAHGAIGAQARVRGQSLSAEITGPGIAIRVKDPQDLDEIFSDDIEVLRIAISRDGADIRAELEALATLAGRVAMEAYLQLDPDAPAADPRSSIDTAPLALTLDLDVADLSPFAVLLPGVSEVGGTLSGRLHAEGPAGAPRLLGRIDLLGQAEVPALALDLNPVTITLSATPGEAALLTGRLHAGSQVIELDASADWNLVDGMVASGRLSGDAIPIAAQPDLNLTVSPDFRFALDRDSIRLEGSATVPEARARIRELPQGGGDTLSQDVVIHRSADDATRELRRDLYLDVTLILGDSVQLTAAGLETRLTGRLRMTESPGVPLAARGRLESREGVFTIYGQTLELRTGRLNFEGPLDNPAVDVVAVRPINGAEAGVRVSGFLDSLETQLFANPAQTEVDTLTMLITGRMPGEASSTDMANVSDAALAFGIGRAVPVVGQMVNRLGIDELAVDSPMDEDAGAIIVGTQLTDDIYVRYTYGLHSRLGGLQIEYRVTNWLSIQTETGTTQAIDLIFRREFR